MGVTNVVLVVVSTSDLTEDKHCKIVPTLIDAGKVPVSLLASTDVILTSVIAPSFIFAVVIALSFIFAVVTTSSASLSAGTELLATSSSIIVPSAN